MKWGMAGFVTAALMVSMVGCAEQPSSPAADDGDLQQLVRRSLTLKEKVNAAGRMTPELRAELSGLVDDVDGWQARTGRNDISVSRSRPTRNAGPAAVAPGAGGQQCSPCPPVKVMFGKLCFLDGEPYCADEYGVKICAYVCITLAVGQPIPPTTPTKR